MNNLDNIFSEFLEDFHMEDQKRKILTEEDLIIIEKKLQKLRMVDEFLTKFSIQGVVVKHKDSYNYSIVDRSHIIPQKFRTYQEESSESYAPGQSIFFDHPAEVEIAIPNDPNKGIVVISVASDNPHAYILNKKFTTYDDVCKCLAKFLLANTVSIEKKYYGIIEERKNKPKELTITEEKPKVNSGNNNHYPNPSPNSNNQSNSTLLINRKLVNKKSTFSNALEASVENNQLKNNLAKKEKVNQHPSITNSNNPNTETSLNDLEKQTQDIQNYVNTKKDKILNEMVAQENSINEQILELEKNEEIQQEIVNDIQQLINEESFQIKTEEKVIFEEPIAKKKLEDLAQVKEIVLPNKLNNIEKNEN